MEDGGTHARSKFGFLFFWALGLLLTLFAILFFPVSLFMGTLFLVTGLYLLPPVNDRIPQNIKCKFNKTPIRRVYTGLGWFVLFLIGAALAGENIEEKSEPAAGSDQSALWVSEMRQAAYPSFRGIAKFDAAQSSFRTFNFFNSEEGPTPVINIYAYYGYTPEEITNDFREGLDNYAQLVLSDKNKKKEPNISNAKNHWIRVYLYDDQGINYKPVIDLILSGDYFAQNTFETYDKDEMLQSIEHIETSHGFSADDLLALQ